MTSNTSTSDFNADSNAVGAVGTGLLWATVQRLLTFWANWHVVRLTGGETNALALEAGALYTIGVPLWEAAAMHVFREPPKLGAGVRGVTTLFGLCAGAATLAGLCLCLAALLGGSGGVSSLVTAILVTGCSLRGVAEVAGLHLRLHTPTDELPAVVTRLARSEAVAATARAWVLCLALVASPPDLWVVFVAASPLVHAASMLAAVFLFQSQPHSHSALPRIPLPPLSVQTLTRLAHPCLHSLQKLILAEGERSALAWAAPSDSLAMYGTVQAVGSLAVRLLLQPIEEALDPVLMHLACSNQDREPSKDEGRRSRDTAIVHLTHTVLQIMSIVAVLVAFIGPPSAPVVWRLLFGPIIDPTRSAIYTELFQIYCLAVACMAVNGCSEAFVRAIAASACRPMVSVASFNRLLLVISTIHIALAVLALTFALPYPGLYMLAGFNAFTLALRFLHHVHIYKEFHRYVSEHSPDHKLPRWSEWMPRASLVLFMVLMHVGLRVSESFLSPFQTNMHYVYHFAACAFAGVACLVAVALLQPDSVGAVRKIASLRKRDKQA